MKKNPLVEQALRRHLLALRELRADIVVHLLPVLRLARLAVESGAQRQGVGPALLRYDLDLALRMARLTAASAWSSTRTRRRWH